MKTGYYVTDEERVEWMAYDQSATPEEAKKAAQYRKNCHKNNVHPTPPSQWIECPVCGYKTPGSLVSHFNNVHGGLNEVAKQLGKLPEEIEVVTTEMKVRFTEYGARSKKTVAAA